MRIFNFSTIKRYADEHADARESLYAWYRDAADARWASPQDVKARYISASIVPNDRVVFNILGNRYRLIAHVVYPKGLVFIRFIGTHAEYNNVNAAEV